MPAPKVLVVATSHDQMGSTGHRTGVWLEELAAPYYALLDGGAEVTLVFIKGGPIPWDPRSLPAEDKGCFAVTKTASDEYVFRAMPLRNVELTVPYFHSGKVWNLEQAVAIMGVAQLGKELTPQETSDIAAFLRTLTGQQPRVELPLLPASTTQTPRPEPLVKNSLEKGDAVEKQNSLR